MSTQNYLAIDLGAETGRTIVGSIEDGKLILTETHRFTNQPISIADGLHWDISGLWREIKAGIAVSAHSFPLQSMGVDTWGVDFTFLDADGRMLFEPFHYRDIRTDGVLEVAYAILSREEIFARTGIQFMQFNSLYQLLAMVKADHPAIAEARTFVTIPDLLNYWLSGKLMCEFTNATTTQCFDPLNRSWGTDILEKMNIPTDIFPPVVEPGTLLGNLLPEVAKETDCERVPVIAPACHDTGSAVVAVPAENQDFAWISSGTWSIMGAEVKQPCLSKQALAYNFTNEGGVFGTWRLSKNIMGLWLVQECKREWNISYDELTHLAAEAKPFLAVIDPDDARFFHPGEIADKIRSACAETRQAEPRTRGEIIRVALESLALKYRLTLTRLESLTGKKLNPIHVFGGGSRNRLLNQFIADGCTRTVVAGPVEATAVGNILIQAIALGHLDSLEEARAMVRRSFDLEIFTPGESKEWDVAYEKLFALFPRLRE